MSMNIKEVAKKAGVSVATISRAMNAENRHKVAPKTLERIDKLVEKFAYTPNLAAKNLRQTRTRTVGVVMPYFWGIFFASYYRDIMAGVSDYLLKTDYNFKMLLLKEDKATWDRYDFRTGERVDGLVITNWPKFFSNKSVIEKINIPCVIINDYERSLKGLLVSGDHFKGGELAAECLYNHGHRKVAVVSGMAWSMDNQQRIEGFKSYFHNKGIEVEDDLVIHGEFQEKVAYEQIEKLWNRRKDFTAVFCCNDHMAFGVIRKLRELGTHCPDDISVIGYDDDSRCVMFDPPLTTVHVPMYNLARVGIQHLVAFLQENDPEKKFLGRILLPVHVVERISVKKIA